MPKIPLARAAFAAAALAAAAPVSAQPKPPGLPVVSYELANGLRVTLHEDHTSPVVAVDVWYHVGSKDEPARRNGFAHLFEHLMFQGSKHVGEDQFFQFLERAGASDRNGTTSLDRTNYFETLPSSQLELALWLESDRMGFLLDHVDDKTFESQRKVVKNERRQNYEDAPYGLVSKFLREALFPASHPYHNLTIGSYEDLDAATLGDVHAFYKTFYLPNNASLVVAGDFEPGRARALVEKYFGAIRRGPQPRVVTTAPPPQPASETILEVEAAVELARAYVSWVTPAFFQPGDAALDALSNVLSEGKSSRLYKRLVYELRIAKDVRAYQASGQLASDFTIVATAQPGHTADELVRVIDEELVKARAQAPSEAETQRAKASLEAHLVFGLEHMGQRADMINHYIQLVGDPGAFSRDIARYRALGPADLLDSARTHLPAAKRVVALVRPNPNAPRCGQLRKKP
jgi:predicted Zn-dependent peptidase